MSDPDPVRPELLSDVGIDSDTKKDQEEKLHGPLSDEELSPEDGPTTNAIEAPDELDAYGSKLEHEGQWTSEHPTELSDEDVAETRNWNAGPVDPEPAQGWINKKVSQEEEQPLQ